MLRLILGGLIVIAAAGCLPILAQETVHEPQPAPLCGDTGRPYEAPQPGTVAAPTQPPIVPAQPAAPPTGAAQ